MSGIFLLVLMVINVGISYWNARVTGTVWREAKMVGGWQRVMAWAGGIQAACGFTFVISITVTVILTALHLIPAVIAHAILSLTYLLIILPLLGSGFAITLESWIVAYRKRDFSSMATAGWNTMAMGDNIYGASSGIGSAFGDLGKLFGGDGDGDEVGMIGIALVAIIVGVSLGSGVLLTCWIASRHMGTLPVPADAYQRV